MTGKPNSLADLAKALSGVSNDTAMLVGSHTIDDRVQAMVIIFDQRMIAFRGYPCSSKDLEAVASESAAQADAFRRIAKERKNQES